MNLEGKRAPDFSLAGSDGKVHKLSDYKEKYLLLYFYPRDNTPGCTKEACSFKALHSQFLKKTVVILGISRDSNESHQSFIRKFRLPFVLLTDKDAKTHKAYCAWGKKVIYGKQSEGVIRSSVLIGPNGNVVKHWDKIANAEMHPSDVLSYLSKI